MTEVFGKMPSQVKVDWRVPEREWNRFVEHIHSEYSTVQGYVGREVESAMREWIDWDGGHEVEQLADRLIQAAGRTLGDFSQKKDVLASELSDDEGETTRVTCRVHPEVKDEFKKFTKEHSEYSYGVELARAIYAHRHGGRWQRVEDKLSRVVDDAEELLSEIDDSSESMTPRKKRLIKICRKLSPGTDRNIHRSVIEDAIEDIAGETVVSDYFPKVVDRLDFAPHPNNGDLFVHESRIDDLAADGENDADAPAIVRKEYHDLTRGEKINGLQITLAKRAAKPKNEGKYRFKAEKAKRVVFDNHPSIGTVYGLMRAAGESDGFTFTKVHGSQCLQVDYELISDATVKQGVESLINTQTEEGSIEDEAEREMDRLTQQATPEHRAVTDGGEDMEDL